MNGAMPKLEGIAGLTAAPDVVRVLEEALVLARSGKVVGVAVVVSEGVGLWNVALAGRQPLELHYGLGQLGRQLEGHLERRGSSIVRAVPAAQGG